MEGTARIGWKDILLVTIYCLLLFGFAGFSGRPLTMHEARLPETSREMLFRGDWLLPTSGGRPWLERPPLPHWVVISAMKLTGHADRVWVVRFPSAIFATITVLMALLITDRLFGRSIAIASAFLLSTSFKFYQYATLAEDDIYLAALVATAFYFFVRIETSPTRRFGWLSVFGLRGINELAFFFFVGLTNFTKGPLMGLIVLGPAIACYLCMRAVQQRSVRPILGYLWWWGGCITIVLTIAWPAWAYHVHPDVLDNWKYDYLGRMSGDYAAINQPWWYYPPQLMVALLPWTPVALLGVWLAWKQHSHQAWMVLCWGIVPLLVLSIPSGKHDHYLVPFIAPWAILAGIGLESISRNLRDRGRYFAVGLVLIGLGYSTGVALFAANSDHTVDDTAFLMRCRNEVPDDSSLYINGKLGPPGNLDFFRIQFYSRPDAVLIHNLSFLRDDRIKARVVYVIARDNDANLLKQLGTLQLVDQSLKSHEMDLPHWGKFTLYKLTFDPNLKRYPTPTSITSLQAMERAPGPWCGPPLR